MFAVNLGDRHLARGGEVRTTLGEDTEQLGAKNFGAARTSAEYFAATLPAKQVCPCRIDRSSVRRRCKDFAFLGPRLPSKTIFSPFPCCAPAASVPGTRRGDPLQIVAPIELRKDQIMPFSLAADYRVPLLAERGGVP